MKYIADEENQLGLESSNWISGYLHGPQQDFSNTSDCGVFVLKAIQCLVKKEPFNFNQINMQVYRNELAKEIVQSKDLFE